MITEGNYRSLDPQIVLAIGRLAQAHGVVEIEQCLHEVLTKGCRADSGRLVIESSEHDRLANAAIEQSKRMVVMGAQLSESADEPLNGSAISALAAWPITQSHTSDAALVVCWRDGNEPDEHELALVDAFASVLGIALERSRQWTELGALSESRTQSVQAVNEELESFAYTMSHDLKTPLTIMKTSIWTVRQLLSHQLDERSEVAMTRLESTVERMRCQVDGMLHMYRLTKDDIRPEVVNISALCRDVLDELHAAAPKRKLTAKIGPEMTVRGDPAMLRVVVTNLLDNAWKYTAKKCRTEISVESASDASGRVVISVRDNGTGFEMARAGELFAVFQRLHSDDEFDGSGIGLASVQRIINKHGGQVWAESELGQGATFYFTLPEALPTDEPHNENRASIG